MKPARVMCLAQAAWGADCVTATAQLARGPRLDFTTERGLRFVVGDGESAKAKRMGELLTRMASPFWLREMNLVLHKVAQNHKPISVFDKMLEALDVGYQAHGLPMDAIPKTGPLIITATHPLFGLDGLTIAAMLKKIRPDVKIVANEMMALVPGFEDASIGVNMEAGAEAGGKSLREMVAWLKAGHVLVIFPSGQITTSPTRPQTWSRSAALLARRASATVLPIFVQGRPGLMYRLVSPFIGNAKKSFYPIEILKRQGSTVDLMLGSLIGPEALSQFSDDGAAIDYIRNTTYQLGTQGSDTP